MPSERPSAIRRGLTWWFSPPMNPYVSVSGAIDFSAAQRYLAALREGGVTVSTHALVAGAVAQTLRAWPVANGRVNGRTIERAEHVGIAMPVNLLGHEGGRSRELSATLVEEAETLSLVDLASTTRTKVAGERTGKVENPVMRGILKWAEAAPPGVLERGLDGLDRLLKVPVVARAFFQAVPVTTALTNPGAAFSNESGALFRATAVQIPGRLVSIGTLWGVSVVQDEVIAVDGRPEVRPMLPVLLVFDHRLFDGVIAGRVMRTFAGILRDPAAVFGARGDALPAQPLER